MLQKKKKKKSCEETDLSLSKVLVLDETEETRESVNTWSKNGDLTVIIEELPQQFSVSISTFLSLQYVLYSHPSGKWQMLMGLSDTGCVSDRGRKQIVIPFIYVHINTSQEHGLLLIPMYQRLWSCYLPQFIFLCISLASCLQQNCPYPNFSCTHTQFSFPAFISKASHQPPRWVLTCSAQVQARLWRRQCTQHSTRQPQGKTPASFKI